MGVGGVGGVTGSGGVTGGGGTGAMKVNKQRTLPVFNTDDGDAHPEAKSYIVHRKSRIVNRKSYAVPPRQGK